MKTDRPGQHDDSKAEKRPLLDASGNPITRFTPISQLGEFVRVDEAAAVLDVSRGCVYEAIRAGQLAHVKLGRLVRIPRSALAAMAGRAEGGDR